MQLIIDHFRKYSLSKHALIKTIMKKLAYLIVSFLVLSSAVNGQGTCCADDQAQLQSTNAGTPKWQSFTAGKSGDLCEVTVNWRKNFAPDAVATMKVFAGTDTIGTLLGSDTVLAPMDPTYKQYTFNYSGISVVAGDTYTISLTATDVNGFQQRWYNGDIYAGGISSIGAAYDIYFITRITGNNTTGSITASSCDTFLSPSGNYTWTSSGTYMDTIPNAVGCDSIITIALTLPQLDTSVTSNGAMLTANATGVNYQWVHCDSNHAIISGATNQVFTPINSGNYAVIITDSGCSDTSLCYFITNTGIEDGLFDQDNRISIYPNPTTGTVLISLAKSYNKVEIDVLDLAGKLISTQPFSHVSHVSHATIQIPGEPGIYFIKITTETFEKFIKVAKF